MHFIVNVKFNRKNLKLILLLSMILTIAISYRAIFHSGSWQNIFIDPLHLKLSSLRLLQTFKDTDINFYFYINENILFALKNYFYLNFELFNFFQSELSDVDSGRVFSVRGIDTIFIFFPVFILSIVIFLILSNYLKEEINFIQSCNAYLLCIFFRGHFVHNLNFIIKLLVLILIINFLLQKFRSKKFDKKFMSKNLISVLTASKSDNLNHYLGYVNSINSQVVKPNELIFVDDGIKNQNFKNFLKQNINKNIKLKYIRNNINLGISKSLNFGLNECSNDFIFRLDIDDIWEKDHIKLTFEEYKLNKNF